MSEPNNHIFINAKQYLNISRFCHDAGRLQAVSIAAVSNYTFSIELMLKALDTSTTPSFSVNNGPMSEAVIKSNIRGHKLKEIYDDLPTETSNKLRKKFKEYTNKEIEPLLIKFNNYFVLSRYYHEPDSKRAYHISDLRELAEGIEKSLENWYA